MVLKNFNFFIFHSGGFIYADQKTGLALVYKIHYNYLNTCFVVEKIIESKANAKIFVNNWKNISRNFCLVKYYSFSIDKK